MSDNRFTITLTGEVLSEDETPLALAEYVNEAGGVMIPGCLLSDAKVPSHWDGENVTITADVTASEVVQEGDYKGDTVTAEWIRSYALGAGDYLIGSGEVFSLTDAQVTPAS